MSDESGGLPLPVQIPAAETPALNALLGLAVAAVVVVSLDLARDILLPITLSALLAFLLAPLVRLLRSLWLGRVVSVLLAILAALGVVVVLGGLIGTQVASLAGDIPKYSSTIEHKIGAIETLSARSMARLVRGYRRSLEPPPPTPAETQADEHIVRPVPVQLEAAPPSALGLTRQLLMPVLSPLATAGIIFTVALFLLLQQEDLRDRMIRLFGSGDLHRTTIAMNDAASRLSRYFLTQLGINAGFGVIIGVGLAVIGVPSAPLWGIIGALMRFVPYLGSFISASLPMALAAAVTPGWTMMIETGALFLVVETIVGQAVEPLLYGRNTGLSPFAVIVAAIFWSWLWGPIGLIISTPLTLCLVVLGRHVQRLEFLDVMLGNRPALSPVESFYQRMLAGDPDEAQAHAETILRDCPLSSYYDDVALKGLMLAAGDAERGVLGPERLKRIAKAMDGLIEELGTYDDLPADVAPGPQAVADPLNDPPPKCSPLPDDYGIPTLRPDWRGAAPVLCIAGRGKLDQAAANMLAQLLGKHGVDATVAAYDAASRTNIATLDLAGVKMICLTYLSLGGAPSSLRFLVTRLRRRLPAACILVGMWSDADPVFTDPAARALIGADLYVGSLRDAVQACLNAGRVTPVTAAA